MRIKKTILLSIMVMLILMNSSTVQAVQDVSSERIMDFSVSVRVQDSNDEQTNEKTIIWDNNTKYIHDALQSYCDHSDPAKWYNPHSTMTRYIRTTINYDPIDDVYKVYDWYQCVFCNYEASFFVSIYDE